MQGGDTIYRWFEIFIDYTSVRYIFIEIRQRSARERGFLGDKVDNRGLST